MIVELLAVSKNDEYYTPVYAINPLLPYLKNFKKIWCPFDTDESYFVKVLRDNGHEVINTHLSSGGNFFQLDPNCDAIVSNPPYSLKTEVLERLFFLKKPFAMLMGIVGLFESRRFYLFQDNKFELLIFNKRVSYHTSYKTETTDLSPPFSSVYVCHNILPHTVEFAEINKSLKSCRTEKKKNKFQLSLFGAEVGA